MDFHRASAGPVLLYAHAAIHLAVAAAAPLANRFPMRPYPGLGCHQRYACSCRLFAVFSRRIGVTLTTGFTPLLCLFFGNSSVERFMVPLACPRVVPAVFRC